MKSSSIQTRRVGIESIEEQVVRLSDDHFRTVIEVNSLNVDLLSDEEQEEVVASYATSLNSLTFPIQILVRILPVDIEIYVAELEQQLKQESSDKLLDLGRDHMAFIRRLARTRTMLERRFFVVVPAGGDEQAGQGRWQLFHRDRPAAVRDGDGAATQLTFRSDEIDRQMNRCGLSARRLSTSDLADLYFTCFCPESARRQHMKRELSEYATLVVHGSQAKGA
jgi:hypothetical protein